MKLAIVVGTRPEIIKMYPIIQACEESGLDYFIIHTGQHYTHEMDRVFFEVLKLPEPKYKLNVGSWSQGKQTGLILTKIEEVLLNESPDIVLVEGDTNSVLGGALAAVKLKIKVGHVEAGLRSYDRNMPEEINRIMTDHISDYLFAPTKGAKDIMLKEGISKEKIFLTGNTIVDAVYKNIKIAQLKSNILSELRLKEREYILITVHRAENVDNPMRLTGIFSGFSLVYKKFGHKLIYPIHPRSLKIIEQYNIEVPSCITIINPLGFIDFLQLEASARLIITDSGGVQEEACILKVPCVTVRENTERPETVSVGANILGGVSAKQILDCTEIMLNKNNTWRVPFGDGTSANKIITILKAI